MLSMLVGSQESAEGADRGRQLHTGSACNNACMHPCPGGARETHGSQWMVADSCKTSTPARCNQVSRG